MTPPPPQRDFELGSPGPMRDRLVAAVLSGEKTATSSLLAQWHADDEPLPLAGERQTMIDSNGDAVGQIEIVSVEVIALGDADLELALAEGEGFRTVAQWREEHERFWSEVIAAELPTITLDDHTAVVVERFALIAGEA